MLKFGRWVLTTWTVLSCLASLTIIIQTLVFGGHTPALFLLLSDAEVQSLSPDTLSTIDSIALFANGLNLAFGVVVLGVVWDAAPDWHNGRLALMLAGFTMAWLAGFMADAAVGYAAPWVNVVSIAILAFGFGAIALGRRQTIRLDKDGVVQNDTREVSEL
ncbi:MAG: hypothetical protein ACE361_01720 [Aureliella sp.]